MVYEKFGKMESMVGSMLIESEIIQTEETVSGFKLKFYF